MKELKIAYGILLAFVFLVLNVHGLIENPEIKIEKEIQSKLDKEEEVFVIVSLKDPLNLSEETKKNIDDRKESYKKKQQEVLSTLSTKDFRIKNIYSLTPGFSGYITKKGLEKLKINPNINNIHLSRKGEYLLDSTIPLINVDDVWRLEKNNINVTGSTQAVCIIDSGIDFSHPDFSDCSEAQFIAGNCKRIVSGYDYANFDSVPDDTAGHGTFVASIVGSNNSLIKGVAPRSKLVILKNGNSVPDEDATQMGIEWCFNNRTKFNISVITISSALGSLSSNDNCFPTNDLSIAIRNAYNSGMTITIAAGNDGSRTKIRYPACVNGSISVGSIDDNDEVSSFSNRNLNLDLMAPGSNICAARSSGTGFGSPTCIDSQHAISQGTSFATPHVAGTVALLQDVYNGQLTPDQIQEALNASGVPIRDSYLFFLFRRTFSRIDVKAALEYLPVLDVRHLDWPTENHDYRRTGFTLLKGDLTNTNAVKNGVNFVLDKEISTEQVVKPTVADLDGNNFMDSVVLVHKTTFNQFTKMYGIETQKITYPYIGSKLKTVNKFTYNISGGAIYFPATLANIDSDSRKEIVTGVRNGTVYAFDVSSSGALSLKWIFRIPQKFSPLAEIYQTMFNGGIVVDDIDLDGSNEIIFADVSNALTDVNFPGEIFVLNGNDGSNQTSHIFGSSGAYGSISSANVDSDDYPEIIVPTRYGIIVLDYNPSTNSFSQKCRTNDALIESSALISDVDKDNDYELVYTTSNIGCAAGRTCTNKLYVRDAQTCANLSYSPISFSEKPRPTPTVANFDSDSQSEIIVSSESSVTTHLGTITAIDSISGSTEWTYTDGGTLHTGFVSPNVADIDNDGNYNIIFGENNGSNVFVLKNDGNLLYKYKVSGFMDNGLAIADVDVDNMAEIVFKRAGSPTQFTTISNLNFPPELNTIQNITAQAGELINLNSTGKLLATDQENDNLTFLFSSPFNSSGFWQTNANDTGNYSVLVEVSDGNLSAYQFVQVAIFNQSIGIVRTLANGTSAASLSFTQAGNLTVKVRLPKNASIIYSSITLKGAAP